MRGDFSRVSFDPAHGFSQVLFQQGQGLVESEFNEQADIARDQLRAVGEVVEEFLLRPRGRRRLP
jgi:hypothetical protein